MLRVGEPAPGIPRIDSLELGRGIFYSLLRANPSEPDEIHISTISRYFDRLGLGEGCQDTLNTLKSIREIESVGSGYWMPTPTRIVPLVQSVYLLVGIAPTKELAHHFRSVRRLGRCRSVEFSECHHLPVQCFDDWVGHRFDTALDTVKKAFSIPAQGFSSSQLPANAEFFNLIPVSRGKATKSSERQFRPVWRDKPELFDGLLLGRYRFSSREQYFVGRHGQGSEFLEASFYPDPSLFQYGLAAYSGKKLAVDVQHSRGSIQVDLPILVPYSTYRVFSAFGRKLSANRWEFCSPIVLPVLKRELARLNCEINGND